MCSLKSLVVCWLYDFGWKPFYKFSFKGTVCYICGKVKHETELSTIR